MFDVVLDRFPSRCRSFLTGIESAAALQEDSFEFGVDENGRAFIEEKSQSGRRRMLLYLVWQDWGVL